MAATLKIQNDCNI